MKSDEEIWAEMECAHAPEEFPMSACRGTNLIGAGWKDGVLRVAFASKAGPKFYRYPGVPEETKKKLVNSPYPDALFTKIVRNKGFKAEAEVR